MNPNNIIVKKFLERFGNPKVKIESFNGLHIPSFIDPETGKKTGSVHCEALSGEWLIHFSATGESYLLCTFPDHRTHYGISTIEDLKGNIDQKRIGEFGGDYYKSISEVETIFFDSRQTPDCGFYFKVEPFTEEEKKQMKAERDADLQRFVERTKDFL